MSLMGSTSNMVRRGRSHRFAVVAAAIVLAAGLIVPISAATADITFGKPTSVSASKVSGSNGLRVSWKAPTTGGQKPVAYKVTWGKSSSASKATYKTYTTGTSTYLSGTSMGTATYYYVWVQPWSEASSSGTATGSISSPDKVKTSSYAYKAPVEVHVANVTQTSAEVTWRTVTGSPGYVMRAYNYTTGRYSYQIGYDGSSIFTGLQPSTKYKFTVANRLLTPSYTVVPGVRMSGFSSASATATTSPASVKLADGTTVPMADAPTDLKMTDRNSSSVTLSWTPPASYDPALDKFRVYYAENQEMTDGYGYTKTSLSGTSGVITGLSANTNYYVRIRMVQDIPNASGTTVVTATSDRSSAIMVKTRSPKGIIAGKLTGASGSALSDFQAIAFAATSAGTPGEVNGVSDVSSSGAYSLELRPGKYLVRFAHVGTGNYTSVWWTTDDSNAYFSGDADTITAALDKTNAVSSVSTGTGATVTGEVTNSSTGKAIRDIYVSARVAWGTATTTAARREVVGQSTTNSSGRYTITGLPPDKRVYIRATASSGYVAISSSGIDTPGAGDSLTYNIKMSPS